MKTTFRHAAMAVCLALPLLAGCGGPVHVEPPVPTGAAVAGCTRLAALLPQTLDGAQRSSSTPESPYVAVWGEGEITLRCGVPRPANMEPTATLAEFNGVGWFPDPRTETLFTAVTGDGYVEVTISQAHEAPEVLAELSTPIGRAMPG